MAPPESIQRFEFIEVQDNGTRTRYLLRVKDCRYLTNIIEWAGVSGAIENPNLWLSLT